MWLFHNMMCMGVKCVTKKKKLSLFTHWLTTIWKWTPRHCQQCVDWRAVDIIIQCTSLVPSQCSYCESQFLFTVQHMVHHPLHSKILCSKYCVTCWCIPVWKGTGNIANRMTFFVSTVCRSTSVLFIILFFDRVSY